jgi:hypothetical protein
MKGRRMKSSRLSSDIARPVSRTTLLLSMQSSAYRRRAASRLLSRERSTVWQAVKLRDGKATWWRNFGSEAEALEAAGLRE